MTFCSAQTLATPAERADFPADPSETHLHPLAFLVHSTLHWMSPHGRAAVDLLVTCGGMAGAAEFFARRLGLRNRHQLARKLVQDGLPPFETLAAWVRLLTWVDEWERSGASLNRLALRARTEPAVYYRTVKRLTGSPWSIVRERGLAWLLAELRGSCRGPEPETPFNEVNV